MIDIDNDRHNINSHNEKNNAGTTRMDKYHQLFF